VTNFNNDSVNGKSTNKTGSRRILVSKSGMSNNSKNQDLRFVAC